MNNDSKISNNLVYNRAICCDELPVNMLCKIMQRPRIILMSVDEYDPYSLMLTLKPENNNTLQYNITITYRITRNH